jgi:hypothetical protein
MDREAFDTACPFGDRDLEARRGSVWRKVDLHVHTPGSSDYAKACFTSDAEKAAEGIVRDCRRGNVDLVALTDHNSATYVLKNGKAQTTSLTVYESARRIGVEVEREDERVEVLLGVEVTAEQVHILVILPPSGTPANDVARIGAFLIGLGLDPKLLGDAEKASVDTSIGDVIDQAHAWGGIAIPAHLDQDSGFLEENEEARLRKLILSKPHLYALEYRSGGRSQVTGLLDEREVAEERGGRPIAWVQSSDCHFVVPAKYTTPEARLKWKRTQGAKVRGRLIGSEGQFTWVKMDEPSFDGLKIALQDPRNRVRVCHTGCPDGRQGALTDHCAGHTYAEALAIYYTNGEVDHLRFNHGANAVIGAARTASMTRLKAFDVVAGLLDGPDIPDCFASVDLLLSCQPVGKGWFFSWLHWEQGDGQDCVMAAKARRVAALKKLVPFEIVTSGPDQTKHKLAAALGIAIPQTFDPEGIVEMASDPKRALRFVEWHFAHRGGSNGLADVRRMHRNLTAARRAKDADGIRAAFEELREPDPHCPPSLGEWEISLGDPKKGRWDDLAARTEAVRRIEEAGTDEEAAIDALCMLEDELPISVRVPNEVAGRRSYSYRLSGLDSRHQAAAALQLLLRSGTAGPLVIGAPETFFRPDQIADSVAPMILAAKDRGRQIILSSRETVLGLAIDCENYFVYAASPTVQNKTIKCIAQGGVDRPEVGRALLRAFEGDERLIELKRIRLQAGRT